MVLATILMAVIWLGLYGLVQAEILSEQSLLAIIISVAPVMAFMLTGSE